MFRVVILHPVIDPCERGSGVGKRIDADIVAHLAHLSFGSGGEHVSFWDFESTVYFFLIIRTGRLFKGI